MYLNTSTASLKSSFPFFQVAVAILSCWAEGKFKKEPEKEMRGKVHRLSFEVHDHTSNRIAEYSLFLSQHSSKNPSSTQTVIQASESADGQLYGFLQFINTVLNLQSVIHQCSAPPKDQRHERWCNYVQNRKAISLQFGLDYVQRAGPSWKLHYYTHTLVKTWDHSIRSYWSSPVSHCLGGY